MASYRGPLNADVSPVKIACKVVWSVYGAYLAYLIVGGVESDLRLEYPLVLVLSFAAAYAAVFAGLVAYIVGTRSERFKNVWRVVAPASLALVCLGGYLDNSRTPLDNTKDFLIVLTMFIESLAPAFFANFRVAYGSRG